MPLDPEYPTDLGYLPPFIRGILLAAKIDEDLLLPLRFQKRFEVPRCHTSTG
ncbi:hypothetical protein HPP92_029044 [Vanilla planifolia]|uniref:Uncharacterized protein n=1 Tax=Vanilla planifolia TaxID=51239 RepID=A0A835P8P3_VANPL|nr:hypothetical protein HPP92_029044 [Vanilla planifolia]KAG0446037.1 hypothetical protein HPP92_029033 [Vanilla planifolia]